MSAEKVIVRFLLAVAVSAVMSAQAAGKVYTWVGGYGGSNWSSANSWRDASNKSGVPGIEDSAIIASGGPNFVAANITVSNLTISVNTSFSALALPAETTVATLGANPTLFTVVGKLEITGSATVTLENEKKTGAGIKFEVGEFVLGESAKLKSDGTGWQWYKCDDAAGDEYAHFTYKEGSQWYANRSLGSGYYWYWSGAGHGMMGKRAANAPEGCGSAYGLKYAPVCPGSPGCGSAASVGANAQGGGTVWIECARGLTVNGTISVSALRCGSTGGASGGSIWLSGKTLFFGPSASLLAESRGSGSNVSSSGGRISIAQNVTKAQLAHLLAGEEPSELTYADEITLVTASAYGGRDGDLRPGTLTTVQGPAETTLVTVQSDGVFATGVSPAYGGAQHEIGSTQTFSAPEYGRDPANEHIRYECLGYVLSNETAEIEAKAANSVDITIGQTPLTLTWHWGVPERRTLVRKPANGSLRRGGEILPGDAVEWVKSGVPAPVEVVPDAGYEFLCWEGNAPYGAVRTNPMVFTEWKIYDVVPILRTAGVAPMARTWNGTGLWTEVANWSPANLPGPGDAVTIASGICTVSNGLAAASLTVADGASLTIGPAGEIDPYLTLTGDAAVAGTGSLTVGYGPNLSGSGEVSVGGNLTLSDAAVLTCWGGVTNDVFSHATGTTVLKVDKALTLGGTSKLVLESEYMTGGSVRIVADTFALGEGAKVDACGRGYRWASSAMRPAAPGIPYGVDYAGGSYGGKGESTHQQYGIPSDPYGFVHAPIHPGSPAGSTQSAGNHAGGLVRIHARKMTVEGTVDANASIGSSQYCACSGGGIWLTADSFTFGANAALTATGGKGSGGHGASGGGGRIAIGRQLAPAQIEELAQTGTWASCKPKRIKDETAFRAELGNAQMTIDVHTQTNTGGYDAPGSFTYVDGKTSGLMLIMR